MEGRIMKTILRNLFILAVAGIAASCSLKEEPTSFVNKHNFYENRDQCYAALNACYIPFNSIYTSNYMIVVEGCTDLWQSNSSTVDSALDVSPSKPQFGATVWEQGYKGVMYCNEAIHNIEHAAIADSLKGPLAAEGRVLRAMYYYILTTMFNGVPYYTCMVDSYQVQDSIRTLPRTPADTIRARLYRDLRDNAIPYFTKENGLQVRGGDAPNNRSGYAHGLMLMAKFAMWNQDWEEALVPLKKLEELYGDFTEARYPLEQIQWRFKNTPESIFEIQHDYSRDGVRYAGNVACIMMPKHQGDGVFDGVKMDGYGTTMPGWNSLSITNVHSLFRPNWGNVTTETGGSQSSLFSPLPLTYDTEAKPYSESGKQRYMTKLDLEALKKGEIRGKKIDRRVRYALGLGNYETGETFETTRKYGTGWPGPKFWCPDIERTYDSNNYRIFRYADAILMMAECYANIEDVNNSLYYLNLIRERAGIDLITNFTGFEDILITIRAERARELGGEFMRKFDLVRWGVWYEQTYQYTHKDLLRQKMLPCHRYYPIPDKQCSLSGYVLDNPEYKSDGLN